MCTYSNTKALKTLWRGLKHEICIWKFTQYLYTQHWHTWLLVNAQQSVYRFLNDPCYYYLASPDQPSSVRLFLFLPILQDTLFAWSFWSFSESPEQVGESLLKVSVSPSSVSSKMRLTTGSLLNCNSIVPAFILANPGIGYAGQSHSFCRILLIFAGQYCVVVLLGENTDTVWG